MTQNKVKISLGLKMIIIGAIISGILLIINGKIQDNKSYILYGIAMALGSILGVFLIKITTKNGNQKKKFIAGGLSF